MRSNIPDLVVELDVPMLMAYGAATWDWHRMHYDADFARKLGFDGPVVDGQMFGALIARQVRTWAGPRAQFIEMEFRNRRFVTAPAAITITSQVVSWETRGSFEQIEIVSKVRDQDERSVIENARTVLRVPR